MTQTSIPVIDPTSAPYWEALAEGRLRLPRCTECGRAHFYPRVICPHCGSEGLDWQDMSGRGRINARTIVHRAAEPELQARTPFVVAIVELDEGPRMTARVAGDPALAPIGAAVHLTPERLTDDVTLPVFSVPEDRA